MITTADEQAVHGGKWTEIPDEKLAGWNRRLLTSDASYRQYPYWNEPYRKQFFSPHYLVYVLDGREAAYVCVVTVGIPGFRIGLVQSGPVVLDQDIWSDRGLVRDLVRWANEQGVVFLRISNSDQRRLDQIASGSTAESVESFPFYKEPRHALLVKQLDDDDELMASFQSVGRYEIRAAIRNGYEIRSTDSPDELTKVWPMFKAMARRKGFRLSSRPLRGWVDLFGQARPDGLARLYSAYLNGERVQSILVVRYGNRAEYLLGALDPKLVKGNVSPSCLIHWRAMRDFHRLGCEFYNLGAPGTILFQFKKKFRPTLETTPKPITLVIRPRMYRLWSLAVSMLTPGHSFLRRILYRKAIQSTNKSVGASVIKS